MYKVHGFEFDTIEALCDYSAWWHHKHEPYDKLTDPIALADRRELQLCYTDFNMPVKEFIKHLYQAEKRYIKKQAQKQNEIKAGTSELVTWGKYRDRKIEELLADKRYCQWILRQTWSEVRYPKLYSLIKEKYK